MVLVLPFPTSPQNGQTGDATVILANQTAIAQAIQTFDGSQVSAGTIAATALAATANPNTIANAITFPFVLTGLTWSLVSGLNGTMTGGTMYYNGVPITVTGIGSKTFTASTDTYVDIDQNGNVTYQSVSNNTVSPAITANSIRVAIISTGASTITNINQGQETQIVPLVSSVAYSVTDGLGNLIYPTDPNRKLLGYRQATTSQTGVTAETDATGLSVPVIVPAGRKIKITHNSNYDATDNATTVFVAIKESTTYLNGRGTNVGTGNVGYKFLQIEAQPASVSTGAHTYKVAFQRFAGTGSVSLAANLAAANTPGPAFIRVELL